MLVALAEHNGKWIQILSHMTYGGNSTYNCNQLNSTHVMPKYHGDICLSSFDSKTHTWPAIKQTSCTSFFFPLSLKATRTIKKLSPSHTHGSPIKRKKNSQPSSPSHPEYSSPNKEVFFNSSQAFMPNLKLEWF